VNANLVIPDLVAQSNLLGIRAHLPTITGRYSRLARSASSA
jgi:hypothetical protein